jgi:hypothetical protein
VPFVAKVVEKGGVEDAAPAAPGPPPPTKSQILALSKYMHRLVQAPRYKLTAKMVQDRSAWDALSPGEKVISDEQHDYALTWPCTTSTTRGIL